MLGEVVRSFASNGADPQVLKPVEDDRRVVSRMLSEMGG